MIGSLSIVGVQTPINEIEWVFAQAVHIVLPAFSIVWQQTKPPGSTGGNTLL